MLLVIGSGSITIVKKLFLVKKPLVTSFSITFRKKHTSRCNFLFWFLKFQCIKIKKPEKVITSTRVFFRKVILKLMTRGFFTKKYFTIVIDLLPMIKSILWWPKNWVWWPKTLAWSSASCKWQFRSPEQLGNAFEIPSVTVTNN